MCVELYNNCAVELLFSFVMVFCDHMMKVVLSNTIPRVWYVRVRSNHTYDVNMTDILKDIGSIWTRLFDHKVFLNGEIQFTLREYEQKRNDIEVEHLFSLLEKVADIKSAQVIRLKESVNLTLSPSHAHLKEGLDICNSISDLETIYQQDSASEIARQSRKVEWEKFVDSMTNHCTEIDNTFEEKQVELKNLYDDLQTKLGET